MSDQNLELLEDKTLKIAKLRKDIKYLNELKQKYEINEQSIDEFKRENQKIYEIFKSFSKQKQLL